MASMQNANITSYVKAFESYRLRLTDIHTDRHTDTTKIIYHAASRVVTNFYSALCCSPQSPCNCRRRSAGRPKHGAGSYIEHSSGESAAVLD